MPARLLVTGFTPFGPHRANPSEMLLRPLADRAPGGAIVSTRVLPVTYREGFGPIRAALDGERPDAVIMMGLGAGRDAVCFERVAVNWRGATRSDEDGVLVAGEKIDPAGPAACFATLPMEELAAACRSAGAPGRVSEDAGTFICNQVFFQTLRHCDRRGIPARAGFVHLPYLPEQAIDGAPAVAFETLLEALTAVLEVVVGLDPPAVLPPEA